MSKQYTIHIPNKEVELLIKTVSKKIKRVIPEIDWYEERSVLLSLINEELENFKQSFAKDISKLLEEERTVKNNEKIIKKLKKIIKELENE